MEAQNVLVAVEPTSTRQTNVVPGESLRSIREAAERWGKHFQTVYQWAYTGKIKTVMLGRSRMVPESEILRVCAEGLKGGER